MVAARRQIVVTAKIGSAANGAAVLEDLLEVIGRGTAKAACNGAEQIEIYGALCALEGGSGICQVLRTTRKALHGDEVLSTGDAQIDAIKKHFDSSRKGLGIKTA
jgi:hypothetical protein